MAVNSGGAGSMGSIKILNPFYYLYFSLLLPLFWGVYIQLVVLMLLILPFCLRVLRCVGFGGSIKGCMSGFLILLWVVSLRVGGSGRKWEVRRWAVRGSIKG